MRFLILDDNPQDRDRISRVLADGFAGAELVTASSRAAYAQALAAGPVDVVLTDNHLSWTDGLTLLRETQARSPGVPVIMVTGSGSETLAIDGLRLGLADYVPKAHLERLLPALRAITTRDQAETAVRASRSPLAPEAGSGQEHPHAAMQPTTAGKEAGLPGPPVHFEKILASISDGLFVMDRDWRYTYLNPQALVLAQKTREEMLGASMWELFPEVIGTEFERSFRHAMDHRVQAVVETYYPPYDVWVECRLYPTPDGLLEFVTDITERKRAEQALRESEDLFRFVAGNVPDTLFFQDLELRYVWIFNPSDPLTVNEVVGTTDADLVPPEEAELLTALKRQVLETGVGARVELQLSPGGLTRWYEAVYEPSRDHNGQLVGLVSYSRDITERKSAEVEAERLLAEVRRQAAELRGERELLQTIYNTVPVMFTVYDPQIQSVTLSKHIEQVTGWTEADTVSTNIMELAYPDPVYRAEIAAYMQLLQPGYRDIEMHTKWGGVVQTSWANVKLPDGRQVGIGIDITERKGAEEALRRYTRELEGLNEANRLLLQEVNHRVKNSLTAILGLIFAEQRRLGEESPAQAGLPRCQSALNDLSERVRSLATAHSLLSAGGWRPLRVDELVGAVIQALLPAASDSQSLPLEFTGAPVFVTPEQAHHLALVIGELVTNTTKYGPVEDRLKISVDVGLEQGEVRLVYRNDGPGYPESVLAGERYSVGLGLVKTIATHSLRGSWSIWNDGGPNTEIRFPANDHLNRSPIR